MNKNKMEGEGLSRKTTAFDNGKVNMPEPLKVALIDMDGVLYDSMPYHAKAWYAMFSELGITTDPDEFFLYEGMTGGATIDLIFQRELNRSATEKEKKDLYARKAEFFVSFGQKKMMPGAHRMLKALKKGGVETILVTGSAQGSLLDALDKDYPGIFPFDKRVTALDVKHGKPNPEPYLKGLEKSSGNLSNTIVIENAPLGVKAGKAAGCFTIAVTTGPIPREKFEEENADLIFDDMESFAEFLEKEWLVKRNDSLPNEIDRVIDSLGPDKVIIVTDETVEKKVIPLIESSVCLKDASKTVIASGESNKNLDAVIKVWETLEAADATRRSVVVNIGGGLVTDLGGFAAATFKRGIRTVNVPTTLLGAVDAATGGKTGINFLGLKNEIGAFHRPSAVIISSIPLETLSREDLLSGFAEMLKTALIADENLYIRLKNIDKVLDDKELLEKSIKNCVNIKDRIVDADPQEQGLRKVLNFGHTAGHAFESLAMERGKPVAHGVAVAHGMLVELILSNIVIALDSKIVDEYFSTILKPYYNLLPISESDIPDIIELMSHDKKNKGKERLNFTLLEGIGHPMIDVEPSIVILKEALSRYFTFLNG